MNGRIIAKSIFSGNKIIEEPIIFFEENGKYKAKLTNIIDTVIKIENPNQDEIIPLNNIEVDGDCIVLKNYIPKYLKNEWLYYKGLTNLIENENERYQIKDVLLASPASFIQFHYRVSYIAKKVEDIPFYVDYKENLQPVIDKLSKGEDINVLLFGDSISNAANSSGQMQVKPYNKEWYFSAIERLEKNYGVKINLINNSRSGYGTEWGVSALNERVDNVDCDLFIVAFGMNDASAYLPTDKFIENTKQILSHKKCPFILISSILPNPDSCLYQLDLRKNYRERLKELSKKNRGAHIDITKISEYYILRKKYCEISGNNFNHPNDFIYKFYEDALVYLLEK